MKNITLLFLLASINLMGQTISRSPETRKDHANVFYNPRYTLFDLFSDEPIFPNSDGKYEIIISSNENKSAQKYIGTGQELAGLLMYKFKNAETHRRWARGEKASYESPANNAKWVSSTSSDNHDSGENVVNSNKRANADQNLSRPIQGSVASGNFSYFGGLIGDYSRSEINLSNPQTKDKNGNFLWGDLSEENKDGFGIFYTPGKTLKIGEFQDLKLNGSGISLDISGRLSIGNFKANEIAGLGMMGFLKDSTAFLEHAKQILTHNTRKLLSSEDVFQRLYVGTFIRNEKNEYVFDGKLIRNSFEEKTNSVRLRSTAIGRQINAKPVGTVKFILESPGISNIAKGLIVHKGELDENNVPKGSGFQYSIYPDKYIRLGGQFNGFFEVNGSREHSSGITHVGLIKDDNVVGEGTMQLEGRVVKGTFKDYMPHGKARIDYNNGDYFEGNFVAGSAEGQGVSYTSSTQEKLIGNFSNGKPNGKMKLVKGNKTTLVNYVDGEKR